MPIFDVTVDTDSSRLTVGGRLGISWGADDGNSSVNGGVGDVGERRSRRLPSIAHSFADLTSLSGRR